MSAEIDVRVQPRSSRNAAELQPDGSVKAWVTAPPADGAANARLCELLADAAGLPKSSVSVVRGHTSRRKRVRFETLEAAELSRRLGSGLGG